MADMTNRAEIGPAEGEQPEPLEQVEGYCVAICVEPDGTYGAKVGELSAVEALGNLSSGVSLEDALKSAVRFIGSHPIGQDEATQFQAGAAGIEEEGLHGRAEG